MSFWVYILQCSDNSYYTGHTDNLEERIAEHQAGEIAGYTSGRRPVKLVLSQEFSTREEALACERQVKGWRRSKKEAMIQGDWNEVTRLAHSGSSFDKLRTNGYYTKASGSGLFTKGRNKLKGAGRDGVPPEISES